MFCRPRGLSQQLLIQEKYVSNNFEYFLLEMHDKIIHSSKIFLAEIWSALLILFDLLKNAVCIPCPINNNFELEASLLQ